MKKMKFRTHLGLLIGLALLLVALMSVAVGKYTSTVTITGNVQFTATLADTFTLQEHKATRNADGSYTLSTTETTEPNSYYLMPGVDIPKDPFITITKKTDIPAYLFVEVVKGPDVGTTEAALIRYQMAGAWQELTGVTGKNKGTVYVYTGTDTTPDILTSTLTNEMLNQTITIPLLTNGITVSQKLISSGTEEKNILSFYATLKEIPNQSTAADVYNQ